MLFVKILFAASLVLAVAAALLAMRLVRQRARIERWFSVIALFGAGVILMRLNSMIEDGESGTVIFIAMAFSIPIWAAFVCAAWVFREKPKSEHRTDSEPSTHSGEETPSAAGTSFDEEFTRDLADIYMQVDEMYQQAKRKGRKDVQERLAPLRDVANTAWINSEIKR